MAVLSLSLRLRLNSVTLCSWVLSTLFILCPPPPASPAPEAWPRCGSNWSGPSSSSSQFLYFGDRLGGIPHVCKGRSDKTKLQVVRWFCQDSHRQFPGQKNSHRVRWTSPSLAPFSMLTFATSATASRNWEKSKPIKLILVHKFLVIANVFVLKGMATYFPSMLAAPQSLFSTPLNL